MILTIDLFGNELFEIRVNHEPEPAGTAPLGFTTAMEDDE